MWCIDARVCCKDSIDHCSGQIDFSLSVPSFKIAGNSKVSYVSPPSFMAESLIRRPIRSLWCHLVCKTQIFPSGMSRVRRPALNHSYALSKDVVFPALMSCSDSGSSAIIKWAPRPASAPPTPIAKYSPPLVVFHCAAAFASLAIEVLGKIALYSAVLIRFRTFRAITTAKSAVCEATITL